VSRVPLNFQRTPMVDRLQRTQFDVLVVGGGITGTGIALDAASRGLTTALVERDDFASGTSSKSSKLVHGGLRYLQQGDIRLVYEALHERQRLRRNAPHLVSVLPFMIPVLTRDGVISRKIARALGSAMWMYDLTGGVRLGKVHRRLSAGEAHAHMPTMPAERLASAYLYYDATTDDARLTLTVAQTAAAHGAVTVNRCEVVGISEGTVTVSDRLGGTTFDVAASVVVNAGGVWSDSIRALHDPTGSGSIRPAKGVHVTLPWGRIRNDVAVVIPVPGDKRSLFVVPWGSRPDGGFEHCYVGTTDTDYDGPLDEPTCTADDVAYLLGALNASLDTSVVPPVTADDVTGTWAGLRPLVAAPEGRTADLSRRHVVFASDDDVVQVVGGKLTTYREMAEDTVDVVLDRLGRRARCRTKRLRLHGATAPLGPDADPVDAHLTSRYGTEAASVRALAANDATMLDPLVPGLPYLRVEALHAVTAEMATSLDDVLTRRTRAHLLDRDATRGVAGEIAALIAGAAGWDASEQARQVEGYEALCRAEEAAAGAGYADGSTSSSPIFET
jgi:glycerol-3-phosphate dehydrogenase